MDKQIFVGIIVVLLLIMFVDKQEEIRNIFNLNPTTQLSVNQNKPMNQNNTNNIPRIPEEDIEINQEQLDDNGLPWGIKDFRYNEETKMLSYTFFVNEYGFVKFGPLFYIEEIQYKDMPFNSYLSGSSKLTDYNITFEKNAYMNQFLDLGKYNKKGFYRAIKNFRDNEWIYHWVISFDVDDYGEVRNVKEQLYRGEKIF